MSFWESRKINKTRKEHLCEYCETIIKTGTSCYNEKGVCNGDFNNYYLCNRCHDVLPINDDNDGLLGEFCEDFMTQGYIKCPECGYRHQSKLEMAEDKLSCKCECSNCEEEWTQDLSAESVNKLVMEGM